MADRRTADICGDRHTVGDHAVGHYGFGVFYDLAHIAALSDIHEGIHCRLAAEDFHGFKYYFRLTVSRNAVDPGRVNVVGDLEHAVRSISKGSKRRDGEITVCNAFVERRSYLIANEFILIFAQRLVIIGGNAEE